MMEEDKTYTLPAEDRDKEPKESYGKFKSAEELVKAYNSLQSEFTKRSQRLAEYEKRDAEREWEAKVGDFVNKYPIAERYADEVARVAAKDGSDADINGKLLSALVTVLSDKVKTPDQMAADDVVIDKVLNTAGNREKIIEQYLEEVNTKSLPRTLPRGGAIPATSPIRPRTIKEAGELAIKILEN